MSNGSIFTSPESAFYEYQIKMENQLCQVCHCLAAGFHHGAYVCEACKKFFKRYSTNQLKTNIICRKSCDLDKIGRRKCSYCRYKKCLSVGMQFSRLRSTESNIDISRIPCRVCGGKSSGFHFGSLTCEGCKGFFRRAESVKERLECITGKFNCKIDTSHKLLCKSCRYRRCIEVGMSKIGSRIGRQPNAVKHHCALEITNHENLNPENGNHFVTCVQSTYPSIESSYSYSTMDDNQEYPANVPCTQSGSDIAFTYSLFLDNVSQEFFIKAVDAINILQKPISELENISGGPPRRQLHSKQSLQEIWSGMMKHFDIHTRILVFFAKKIPGFNTLSLNDKRTLVQEAMYSIILLNLSKDYREEEEKSLNYFDFSTSECQAILIHFPQMNKILSHVIEISKMVYKLKINKLQIGLLCLLELSKNYKNTENFNVVQEMNHHVFRIFWISIWIDLDSQSMNSSKTPFSSKISAILQNFHCPTELINLILNKIPTSMEDEMYRKFYILFTVLGQKLHDYNIEHQNLIDKLKQSHPELPYPELYKDMFQLSNF